MSNSPKLSVIVPVYNVERYLDECVRSVLGQSYENFELILVDDGSTDSSGKMCDALAAKDSRIKVVHKRNGGLSSARNAGIRAMNGEYVLFLDSDDYWNDSSVMEELSELGKLTDADVLCYGYQSFFEDTGEMKTEVDTTGFQSGESEDKTLEALLANGIYTSSACTKLIKASVIKSNKLFFEEGITSEDIDWSARLLLCSKRFDAYNKNFYIYRQRGGSITHTKSYENIETLKRNIVKCIDLGKDLPLDNFRDLYYNYVAYQYITLLHSSLHCEQSEKTDELVKSMKQYEWLLKYHLNQKVRVVYTANRFLGYKFMYRALKLYLGR